MQQLFVACASAANLHFVPFSGGFGPLSIFRSAYRKGGLAVGMSLLKCFSP